MKKFIIAALVLAASATVSAREAKEIYDKTCKACHDIGAAGAPKVGDAAAWKPRLDKGEEVLMNSINNGLNAMPPKGMCYDCSTDEYKALIKFMSTGK